MATIEFENGVKVNFEGNPSAADVEEVAQKIGIQQPKTSQAQKRNGIPYGKTLPTAVSILGGIAGGTLGVAGGPPGVVAGAVAGGALGGLAGEGYRQAISDVAGMPVQNPGKEDLKEFGIGAASSLGGEVLGLAARPVAGLARGLYQSALKPTAKLAEQGVVQTGLKEGITVGQKGLTKTTSIIGSLNDDIARAIKDAGKAGATVNADDVVTRLQSVKDFYGNTVLGKSLVKEIDEVGKAFTQQHGKELTVEAAQTLKKNTNVLLRKMYGQISTATGEATKGVVRGLKEEIVKQVPEVAKLNARESTLIPLEKALTNAVRREANKNPIGLLSTLGGVGGFAAGGALPGIATALGVKVVNDPRVVSKIAIILSKSGAVTGSKAAKGAASALLNVIGRGLTKLNQ